MPTKAQRRAAKPPAPILNGEPIGAVACIEPAAASAEKSAAEALVCRATGCGSPDLARALISQAHAGHGTNPKDRSQQQIKEVLAFVEGIAPTDVSEAALAAQMCALHNLGMRALHDASHAKDDTIAGVMTARALRLLGAYRAGLEALDRHRRGGKPQVVRVERVTVNAGGQAVVGVVDARVGGGGKP